MIKNIFFDRDGVINEIIFRDGITTSPRIVSEFKFKNDFKCFYEKIIPMGLNLFIVSNQPEISRNLLTLPELDKMTNLISDGFRFNEIMYCLHNDSDNCNCRKPKPGMIDHLLKKFSLKHDESVIIGDSWKDIQAGNAADITTVFLKQKYNDDSKCKPDFIVTNLEQILNLELLMKLPAHNSGVSNLP